MNQISPPNHRPIRSYVRREGRMTKHQTEALQNLWPQYGLEPDSGLINFQSVFSRIAPVVLEIGFGMGKSLFNMAAAAPEKDFIGIEVHRPGVGTLLADLAEQGVSNVRVFCADANVVLAQCIPDQSLDVVQIFFPDPWPKKRHHKRRLIQPAFINFLRQKLKPQGKLHLATDWEDYALQMMEVVSAAEGFCNPNGIGQFSPRPDDRPLTKYEQRGHKFGHAVWDLIFNTL